MSLANKTYPRIIVIIIIIRELVCACLLCWSCPWCWHSKHFRLMLLYLLLLLLLFKHQLLCNLTPLAISFTLSLSQPFSLCYLEFDWPQFYQRAIWPVSLSLFLLFNRRIMEFLSNRLFIVRGRECENGSTENFSIFN